MFTIILMIFSIISSINAATIISRSQSSSLPHHYVLGSKARLTIGNKVIAPDGFNRSATLVNGMFPGPIIKAMKGDNFSIEVVNNLTDSTMFKSTSVHWHGLFQNKSNFADGVSFVTQCPIVQNNTFLYSFSSPTQAGTYWYHSHYSVQQCDGLRGALIIYDPQDPLAYMYDIDDENTVITLADWYHVVAPVLRHIIGNIPNSTLINGLGRYAGGPESELAVINVKQGKRYRFRLIAMACEPNFQFSIDGHNLTVIEADGELTEPLIVEQIQIFPGQRYSVVLVADQIVGNYWMRALPNSIANASYEGGTNSAILRYEGAPMVEPPTINTTITNALVENNLHALINPGASGLPGYGKADINLNLTVTSTDGLFYVNDVSFKPPTIPVLLQILSGAVDATQFLSNDSVIVLEANKVVELTLFSTNTGGPHPIHLHGHAFDVVQSAGNSTFNYVNPVRRDVVSAGNAGERMVIRWVTDNSGPWFLHCHIDWHLDAGFAIVMAESPQDTLLTPVPSAWEELCPNYEALTDQQFGGGGFEAYEEAANLSSRLYSFAIPSVSPISLPSILPPLTLPATTLPPLTLSSTTLPPLTLPATTLPSITLLASTTLPATTLPSITLLASTTLPPLTLPSIGTIPS